MDPRDKLAATLPGVHNVTGVSARAGSTNSSHGIDGSHYVDLTFHGLNGQTLTQAIFFRDFEASRLFARNVNQKASTDA